MYLLFISGEIKKWLRDPMTRFMIFYPILFGIIGRYALPAIAENSDFSIEANADIILAVLALITPVAYGAVIGFSILDDRDDHIMDSIRVTPLTLNFFMLFRLIIVFLFSFAASLFIMWFAAISDIPVKDLLLIAFLASLSAPFTGLLINIFASNKIEGFAMMKLVGIVIILPIISLFFHDVKELFFGIVPAFWPAKIIAAIIRGESSVYLNYNLYFWIGLLYVMGLNVLIYRRFIKKSTD
ncbi:MAG: ABC transporter permease [Bacillota bacterium]|nr:ABC transporter permease [Bacillota bacterium]MDW7728924.1 ABC transporter permease [Bacillota bacterium]